MIRKCVKEDAPQIFEIINDAAQVYKGVIPADLWKEPYMPMFELLSEIEHGVEFWGYEREGRLLGVMGIQCVGDASLIRHAYVRTEVQHQGIGSALLSSLTSGVCGRILIGTWQDASWAIAFYKKQGFQLMSAEDKDTLLRKYWSISDRQRETSVVLTQRRS